MQQIKKNKAILAAFSDPEFHGRALSLLNSTYVELMRGAKGDLPESVSPRLLELFRLDSTQKQFEVVSAIQDPLTKKWIAQMNEIRPRSDQNRFLASDSFTRAPASVVPEQQSWFEQFFLKWFHKAPKKSQ
jgi:hypothetical protein